MEKLKSLFGSEALTFDRFSAKLAEHPDIKLADLGDGEYVAKAKYDTRENELKTANATIRQLQDAVKKFDGVDVEGLKKSAKDWEDKYNRDTASLRLSAAVDTSLLMAHAKNPRLVRGCLDMEKLSLDGDKVVGLSEQLEALRASDAYLFESEQPKTPAAQGTGLPSGSSGEDLSALSDAEYYARVMKKT